MVNDLYLLIKIQKYSLRFRYQQKTLKFSSGQFRFILTFHTILENHIKMKKGDVHRERKGKKYNFTIKEILHLSLKK